MTSPETAPPPKAPLRNKLGQAIHERGQKTRARLIEAARTLLDTNSPMDLTVFAVAKQAGVSPASFYVHFADVAEVLLALCATVDLSEVVPLIEEPWPAEERRARARAFIEAFYNSWDRHRRVLAVRNLESDLGDPRFFDQRYRVNLPIIDALAEKIAAGRPGEMSIERAWAWAAIIFAGFEQLCVYPSRTYIPERPLPLEVMMAEQVEVLMQVMAGPGTEPPPAAQARRPK